MKRILFILSTLLSTISYSQINFSAETIISNDTMGYGRPRMAITANDIPVVIWFKEGSNQSIKISRGTGGGTFLTPTDVVSPDLDPTGFIGPEIAAKGDTIYITFICGAYSNDAIMIKKSFDGGLTFSDTVRVSPNDNSFKYSMPNVAVKDDGNPIVTYMQSSSTWTDWEQMVNISTDYGTTFLSGVDASAISPGEPCDCCKSTIVTQGNDIYLLFRNDVSNVRNTYISKSTDGGLTFTSYQDLDDLNWSIPSCPTSSPNGVINGDSILVASRSGATGIHQVYYTNVNSYNLQNDYYRTIDEIGPGLQDKVEVAGEGNTLGIVWQDSRSGNNACYLSYTTDGASNIGGSIEMSDSNAVGHKMLPDIEYSNGKFHFVYTYNSGHSIIYKTLDLSGFNAINTPNNTDKTLLKTADLLGRECVPQKNIPYLNIYKDGTVEKRIELE
ncbi:MAG: sialidase family protein [Flavobacteriales bacterium]